ncbi:MAG: Ig-like domain-containing protein [Thermoplasmata archaeon]
MKTVGTSIALGLIVLSFVVQPAIGEESAQGTRSNGERTVMLELFTATWCIGCPYADAAADRLLRVVGPERVSVIQYHVTQTDPLRINESDERRGSYGDPQLPSLFLDGELKSVGATSYEETLEEYLLLVQEGLEVSTSVSLELSYDISAGAVTLEASVGSTEPLVGQNLIMRFALFENILEVDGKTYNYSVRAFNETSIDPVSMPYVQSVTFSLDPSWIVDNMGAAVFLQTDAGGHIHQSANLMFGAPPVITIADTTADTVAGNHTIEGSCTGLRQLSEVFVRIDDGIWVEAEGAADWNHTFDTRELSDGSHTVQARVYDISGVYSQPDTLSFIVRNKEQAPSTEVILILVVFLSGALFLGVARRRRV